jgi:hypothetical protein
LILFFDRSFYKFISLRGTRWGWRTVENIHNIIMDSNGNSDTKMAFLASWKFVFLGRICPLNSNSFHLPVKFLTHFHNNPFATKNLFTKLSIKFIGKYFVYSTKCKLMENNLSYRGRSYTFLTHSKNSMHRVLIN